MKGGTISFFEVSATYVKTYYVILYAAINNTAIATNEMFERDDYLLISD